MALKDITLGQYFPGNSIVHRLDPRTKLIAVVLYIVALFLAKSFVTYGIMFLLLAVSIGAILYYIVLQVVLSMGMNPNYLKLLSAAVVAVFLSVPYWKGKYAHVKVPAGSANAGAKTGGDQDA